MVKFQSDLVGKNKNGTRFPGHSVQRPLLNDHLRKKKEKKKLFSLHHSFILYFKVLLFTLFFEICHVIITQASLNLLDPNNSLASPYEAEEAMSIYHLL